MRSMKARSAADALTFVSAARSKSPVCPGKCAPACALDDPRPASASSAASRLEWRARGCATPPRRGCRNDSRRDDRDCCRSTDSSTATSSGVPGAGSPSRLQSCHGRSIIRLSANIVAASMFVRILRHHLAHCGAVVAIRPPHAQAEEHGQGHRPAARQRDVGFHQPPEVDHAADRGHVDEAVQRLPAAPELPNREAVRREREREQDDEHRHADGDERAASPRPRS